MAPMTVKHRMTPIVNVSSASARPPMLPELIADLTIFPPHAWQLSFMVRPLFYFTRFLSCVRTGHPVYSFLKSRDLPAIFKSILATDLVVMDDGGRLCLVPFPLGGRSNLRVYAHFAIPITYRI